MQARAAEGFNKTYGIVHPAEQWESNRGVRLSPFYAREQELGAVFFEAAGWERPHWYESNAKLLDEFGDRINRREAEWESRWWSPIINAEHLAMRERAAMFDLTAFCIFDVTGPGALETVQQVSMRQMDVAIGKVVYTPVLSPSGTFKSDLTVMRLGDEQFRVVTGGAHGMADLKWYADHLPERRQRADHRPHVGVDDARPVGAALARHPGEPHLRRRVARGVSVRERAATIELGLAARARLADLVRRRARLGALRADRAGSEALGSRVGGGRAARHRAGGHRRLRHDRPAREVLPRVRVRARRRLRRRRGRHGVGEGEGAGLRRQGGARRATASSDPIAVLCTLTVDDHTSKSGVKRYMLGREPVLSKTGEPLVDAHGRRSYVTSAGAGPSIGKHILMSYLPPENANVGEELLVEYLGEQYPVTRGDERLDAGLRPGEHAGALVRILCCVKRVPITGGRMVLTDDEQAIETRHLGFTISPHEECGVEEAVRIVEAHGGEVVVLTLGPPEAEEQMRDCMAIGADRGDPPRQRRGVGRAGDGGRDRRGDPRRGAVRPDRLRQRVGGRGQLPGRDPRRVRARAAGRHRPEGADGRRRPRALRAGGARADATSTTCRCRRS